MPAAPTPVPKKKSRRRVRYAVVGLGHIAQVAVLPAFKHAPNAELAALVSGEPLKLKKLGQKYKVKDLRDYDGYLDLLQSGSIDAVYLCLPNHLHRAYTIQAAEAGIHVLCEKPLAVSADECQAMIRACDDHRVLLMTAYRLHFDPATLRAMAELRRGAIGEPLLYHGSLSHVVRPNNIRRAPRELGGGPMYDLGIYCINGARTLFRSEPVEVSAYFQTERPDAKLGVETSVAGVLRFPGDKLATFECSNGSVGLGDLSLSGSKGKLHLQEAFAYRGGRRLELTIGEKARVIRVPKRDQFAPEIIHFADCILKGRQPQPSGWEGLADVRIIEAIFRSAQTGQAVTLPPFEVPKHPQWGQQMSIPPVEEVEPIKAESPSAR